MQILSSIMGRIGRINIYRHRPGIARVDIVLKEHKEHFVSIQAADIFVRKDGDFKYDIKNSYIMSLETAEDLAATITEAVKKARRLHGS